MDSPDDVLEQMQEALKQVKDHVAECVKQAGPEVREFKANLSLTGDPDIGTLIDASALTTMDGKPLSARLDDCVRDVMQTLALPPMRLQDEFKVSYQFQFE